MKNPYPLLTYEDVKKCEIFAPFVNRLAEISAKSTMKFLEHKDGRQMITDTRNSVIRDCKYLASLEAHADDEITEKTYQEAREERNIIDKEISMIQSKINRMVKLVTYDENQYENLVMLLADKEAEREVIANYIEKAYDYLCTMQNDFYSNTLSDNGYDIVNIAKRAILKILQTSANAYILLNAIYAYNGLYTFPAVWNKDETLKALLDDKRVQNTIVAIKHYKTKEGYQTFTLKQFADAHCRMYVNKRRSGIATKTQYLITGHDEEGHETYIQSDKLLTAGGITDIFRKEEFDQFMKDINMTESEKLIARLLMEGRTHEQIGKRLGVTRQAVEKRIAKLQARLNDIEEVQNRRRYMQAKEEAKKQAKAQEEKRASKHKEATEKAQDKKHKANIARASKVKPNDKKTAKIEARAKADRMKIEHKEASKTVLVTMAKNRITSEKRNSTK